MDIESALRDTAAGPIDVDRGCGGLQVFQQGDPGRDRIEAFIRSIYADRYGARVEDFAPVLVACTDPDDGRRIIAAAGYRCADQPLFLERYLDAPIDRLLSPERPPARAGIVEVGHLSSARPGEGRRLILGLAAHLTARRTEWVASTVTRELRQMFVRLGLGAIAIAPARADRLADAAEAAAWGSYYSHEPIVMAGHLPTALRGLRRRGAAA